MKILRVFNNNVVLAKDGAREVIVTGRGLGFQAKPGQRVDGAKIVRVFVPADGRDPDHIAELLSEIPPEIIRLVTDAMTATGLAEQAESQPTLVMALADHICGAIQRAQRKQNIEYPLEAEVRSLYADEYAKGVAMVDAMNTYLGGALPRSEAVALALHLVNAGFSGGDLSATYTMTGIIQQMIAVIERMPSGARISLNSRRSSSSTGAGITFAKAKSSVVSSKRISCDKVSRNIRNGMKAIRIQNETCAA